jgi:hypothetical protein
VPGVIYLIGFHRLPAVLLLDYNAFAQEQSRRIHPSFNQTATVVTHIENKAGSTLLL